MKIQVTARHFKASEQLQTRIQDEIDRLERFYERITKCHVVLDAEKRSRMATEITVGTRGKTLVAKAFGSNMGKVIDETLAKIERQLKKHNQKIRERRSARSSSANESKPQPTEEVEEF